MKIGLIAPPWLPVPPTAYGGTEAVVDNLARGLVARGHDVRLFTVGDSTSPVTRRHLYAHPVTPMGASLPEAAHVLAAYEELSDVDIIHDHTILGPLLHEAHRGPPIVSTHHGTFTDESRRAFARIAERAAVVAISHSQARTARDIPIAAVIHHGIDLDVHYRGPGDGGYLVFVGRMAADKGVHRAVRIARRAGLRLVLITKLREPGERAYYEREVRPLLRPGDEPPVEMALNERVDVVGGALAMLNPICWNEPFGLVMAESLACGTPVLATPRGAAPEIVDHTRTGYLAASDDALVAALRAVPEVRRDDCRGAAERRFSAARMAHDYEELYARVLEGPPVGDRSFSTVLIPGAR